MDTLYVGFDAGSKLSHWWGAKLQGDRVDDQRIRTDDETIRTLFEELSSRFEVHLHMEATTYAGHLRYIIKPHVQKVVVSDPRYNSHVSDNPHKSDREDARRLSELLRTGVYEEVWYPDQIKRWVFRQLVLHYDMLDKEMVGMKSRIHARYLTNGVFRRGNIYDPKRRQELLDRVSYPEAPDMIEQLYDCSQFLEEQKEKGMEQMWSYAQQFPEIDLFTEVPGVGPVVASRFSAYIGDPHRFPSNKKVRRYSKLAVAEPESCDRPIKHEQLDQSGRGALKDASYLAVTSSIGSGNVLDRKYQASLRETGSKTNARLNTQRKVIDCLWSLWRKQESFDPDRFLSN